MEKNLAIYATVPKYKAHKREIWTAETIMYAMVALLSSLAKSKG